jgi:hypothetical protein
MNWVFFILILSPFLLVQSAKTANSSVSALFNWDTSTLEQ